MNKSENRTRSHDQKLSEIARVLNENTNTVKTILYRSLRKLKLELTEGELGYEG